MSESSEPIDWGLLLLYLTILVCILLIGALVVYVLFYLYSYKYDKSTDEDEEFAGGRSLRRGENDNKNQKPKSKREIESTLKSGKGIAKVENQERIADRRGNSLIAAGKQTMLSSLQRSATDSDVVLATALSAIPLKELGGKHNNIIVDVGQQMYLNKGEKAHEEHECIVCRTRKDVTWDQVSCYAQTTIGVLVYKRTLNDCINQQVASPSSELIDATTRREEEQTLKQFFPSPTSLSNQTSPFLTCTERTPTISNVTIAPPFQHQHQQQREAQLSPEARRKSSLQSPLKKASNF